MVIIAEDEEIRDKLAEHDINVQTVAEAAPIEVQPAKVLSHLYSYLGIIFRRNVIFQNNMYIFINRTKQEIGFIWTKVTRCRYFEYK